MCSCLFLQAAVRALDTMASFAIKNNPEVNLTKFVVAGASKVQYVHVYKYTSTLYVHILECLYACIRLASTLL